MRFDEIWSGPEQLQETARLAASTRLTPGFVIEIGAWQGLTSIAIANAIFPDRLQVVDHWKGSADIPAELSERDNFAIFLSNMAEGTKCNYSAHKEDWRDFAEWWTAPIRFIHIDAGHDKDEVAECIEKFRPFVSKGGIIAGDDWNWTGVQQGVTWHFEPRLVNTFVNKLWWVEIW